MDAFRSGRRGIGKLQAVLGLLVLGGAVTGGAYVTGVVGAPSVVGVSNHFVDVTAERTTIATELVVNNPNPIGVTLGNVSVAYAVDMNDVRLATGEKEGVAIENGNTTVALETDLHNGKIPAWWVSHLRNGEHSELVVHATVTSGTLNESVEAPKLRKNVDTDIASSFNSTERRPIEADQPGVSDPVLYVEETSGWWGDVTSETTNVEMRFVVYNPKSYAIPVNQVTYDVDMNGVDIGQGSTERSYVIPAGGTRTVAATLELNNQHLDEWWFSHLQRNQRTNLTMQLSLVVDLSNAGGPTMTVPVDTIHHTIDTDIFGNKAQYPTGNGTASDTNSEDDSDGDASTPTGDGSDTTEGGSDGESTPTTTPTPTPTSTPTDDGIVGDAADLPTGT